jgi:6-phosphogluconate dehydrogenase
MKLGYVGLGKMGLNMVERLLEKGNQVVAFDRDDAAAAQASAKGAETGTSLAGFVAVLPAPRLVWVMVPYRAVDAVLGELVPLLATGDTVIDGGNSPYKESIRRSRELAAKGIDFLEAGVSGGPAGARKGACIMVGGRQEVFRRSERLFADLSVEKGYGYMGRSGAGHFVKMVHNGIEYGMMQAYAEGFEILHASDYELDLEKISDLWNHGSVVRSWLLELATLAFNKNGQDLEQLKGWVADSGEGRWTVQEAIDHDVPAPIITLSLLTRFRSRQDDSYTGKVLAALRNEFGGHAVKTE